MKIRAAITMNNFSDTLKQARKAAEDSDFSASEGPQGKGHRLKFPSATAAAAAGTTTTTSKYPPTSRGTSSDDENDKGDNGKKPAAEMPKMDKKLQKKSTKVPPTTRFSKSDKGCPNNNDQPLEVQNLESIEENNDLYNLEDDKNNNSNAKKNVRNDKFSEENILNNGHDSSVPFEHDSNIINGDDGDDDERFHTLNEKLDSCLRLLRTLMVDMKDLKQRISVNNGEVMNETTSIVKNDLPLNSREEVSVVNGKLLESMDYYREFVRVVKQVGGAHGREHTERVLHTIFSKSFAAQNTWEGKKTKFKLNDLKLIKTCEEVILKKFPWWTSAEFSKAATNWFRLGSQRAGLQKGQRQKQKDHEDTRNKDTSE